MEEQILDFFKTFIDPNRLRLAALLLEGPATVDEIANRLRMRPSDVPRQLTQIERLGLLVEQDRQYRIDPKAMERLSREALAGRRPSVEARSNDETADEFDRNVVKNFSMPDGKLKEIPMHEKKLMAILRHVVQVFEPGRRYTEKEVNVILAQFYKDVASLRRYLIDRKLILREPNGSSYWRPEPSDHKPAQS